MNFELNSNIRMQADAEQKGKSDQRDAMYWSGPAAH